MPSPSSCQTCVWLVRGSTYCLTEGDLSVDTLKNRHKLFSRLPGISEVPRIMLAVCLLKRSRVEGSEALASWGGNKPFRQTFLQWVPGARHWCQYLPRSIAAAIKSSVWKNKSNPNLTPIWWRFKVLWNVFILSRCSNQSANLLKVPCVFSRSNLTLIKWT